MVRRRRGRVRAGEERRGRELCVLRPAHAFRDPRLNLSTFFSAYSHPQECLMHRATLHPDSICPPRSSFCARGDRLQGLGVAMGTTLLNYKSIVELTLNAGTSDFWYDLNGMRWTDYENESGWVDIKWRYINPLPYFEFWLVIQILGRTGVESNIVEIIFC